MAKEQSRKQTQNEPGVKADQKLGLDIMRFATLAGVLALVAISFLIWRSIEQIQTGMDGRLIQIEKRLVDVAGKMDSASAKNPPARRGPDPNLVYALNTSGAPVKGPAGAAVTIVEFSDFQCPFCSRVGPTLKRIQEVYGNKVRIVWKNLPLANHKNAEPAARAAMAAFQQGKFWEFHDRLFANQSSLSAESYLQYARDLGLDIVRFARDMSEQSATAAKPIETDKSEANSLGITGTPAFFVNGRYLSGAKPFDEFAKLIDEELARPRMR